MNAKTRRVAQVFLCQSGGGAVLLIKQAEAGRFAVRQGLSPLSASEDVSDGNGRTDQGVQSAKPELAVGIVPALCYWLCRLCVAISGILPYSFQVEAGADPAVQELEAQTHSGSSNPTDEA